jgi:hypothetical protein
VPFGTACVHQAGVYIRECLEAIQTGDRSEALTQAERASARWAEKS